MNINQVKYFAAAVEQGSFSDAARELAVTTQAVSKSIAELEREVGCDLLVRDKSGVYPNQRGIQFYDKSRAALESFRDLERFAREISGYRRTHDLELALCVPSVVDCSSVCDNIARLLSKGLGASVGIVTLSGEEALKAMREGALDALIIIGTLDKPGVKCQTIGHAPPMVCFSETHPLAVCDAVTMGQLADYPVGFFPIADRFNRSILNVYLAKGLASPIHTVRRLRDLNEFYSHANGYAFMLSLPLDGNPFVPAGATCRPIAEEDAVPIPLCIGWIPEQTTPRLERLVEMVSKSYSAFL